MTMDHTKSPFLDRFFAAAILTRQLLSEAQLAELLDVWPQPPTLALAEFAVERGVISKTEIKGFYAFLDRSLGADAVNVDELITRQTIGLIRNTFNASTHPTIRAFLSGQDGRSVPSRLVKVQNFYRTVELKGEGGMGRVWLAHDIALDRPVALKQFKVGNVHPDARQQFIREAQITGQLQHPSIVPLYRMGVDPQSDEVFYTMRFFAGRTLSEHVAEFQKSIALGERNRVALLQLLAVFLGACQAIHYAHSRGIVHRDLKPAKIMIGDFGEVIVIDWGLAKRLHAKDDPYENAPASAYALANRAGDESTQAGTSLGTPAFMAPEQAVGNSFEIGPATDVFALGGILFHILTGSAPHVFKKGGTAPEFALQIALSPPPLARTLAPWAPPALEAICVKAMALNVADRYPDVGALIDDVRRWIAGDEVSVYPENRWRKLARWVMRQPFLWY